MKIMPEVGRIPLHGCHVTVSERSGQKWHPDIVEPIQETGHASISIAEDRSESKTSHSRINFNNNLHIVKCSRLV